MTSRTPYSLLLAAVALLALSACGNKGPLVMPQKPVPIEDQAVDPDADVDAAAEDVDGDVPVDVAEPVVDDTPATPPVPVGKDGNE